MNNKGYIDGFEIFILVCTSLVLILLFGSLIEINSNYKKIGAIGYDSNDVRVFLNSIGNDADDFLKSPSLRKQYELYREGKTSQFIEQSRAEKKKDDAHSSGLSTGLAIGIGTGMGIGSSR